MSVELNVIPNERNIEDGITTFYFDGEPHIQDSNFNLPWYKSPFYQIVITAVCFTLIFILMSGIFFGTLAFYHERRFSYPPLPVPHPVFADKAAVAAEHSQCSKIGVRILREGGNAIDSAIATAICSGVLNPFASGIGGGNVMNIRLKSGENYVIDAREVSPLRSHKEMFNKSVSLNVLSGPLSAAVPMELLGLEEAFKRFGSGKVTWERLFTDSIQMARDGFKVGKLLASKINKWKSKLTKSNLASIFVPNGNALDESKNLKMEQLANTLESISKEGSNTFYRGKIAESLVKDVQSSGGILSLEDLSNATVQVGTPLSETFGKYQISCPSLPFSGCLILFQTFKILEGYTIIPDLLSNRKKNGPMAAHLMSESFKFGFSNRIGMSDPKFSQFNVSMMMSKEHAKKLKEKIDPLKSNSIDFYLDLAEKEELPDDEGGTHISVIDEERNAVSFSSSINSDFGSMYYSPSTGIILNNQMECFSNPNRLELRGISASKANYIEPLKRPLSSMTPIIGTLNNKVAFVVGGSGGTRIPTALTQILADMIYANNDKPVEISVVGSRFHSQWIPDKVITELQYEEFREDEFVKLEKVGNEMEVEDSVSAVQVVVVTEREDLVAVSDSRRFADAEGY
eukprot:TRINITY_DN5777_c0_g3_i1.p1 TRINITY_DN5777_c0_g3~~TRINITY_DN5777_c0_g3_i1.p1  ORF type:complete len:629 (+),score=189.37 TRINITY_DN5777_c0_g3_i1:102-1988(+)